MAIKTSVQTRYSIQKIASIVVCLVLGLWGVYDYAVKIPAQQRAFERGEVYRAVKAAIEDAKAEDVSPADARAALQSAADALRTEIEKLAALGITEEGEGDPERFREALKARNDEQWAAELVLMRAAVNEVAQTPRAPRSDAFVKVFERVEARVDEVGAVSEPSTFDRMIQWAFILCLPFVPWVGWQYWTARRKTYRLDDDGTLHSPLGTWAEKDIADIDMSRWMSKSIATVVHRDGSRLDLDDFVHKNVHLIVGRLAHARYPDQWHEDARQVKDAAPAATATAPPPAEPAPADADAGEPDPAGSASS